MTQPPNYKVKQLKTYSSTEWFADGKKNYHQVFEEITVDYIYAELSLYNKQFDRSDWTAEIELRCVKIKEGQEEQICKLEVKKEIKTSEPIAFIREGWGDAKKGYYWKSGSYKWKVYAKQSPVQFPQISAPYNPKKEAVESIFVLIAEHTFHVEQSGITTNTHNPYFDVVSLQLYENDGTDTPVTSNRYASRFRGSTTRYIWLNLNIKNKQIRPWMGEFFCNFYNSAGQLKGNTIELKNVTLQDDTFIVKTAWGSNQEGTWFPGHYRAEIVFMDIIVAVEHFEVF